MNELRLGQNFYNKHVVNVARNLIGKKIVFREHQGIITETEAYRGEDDKASHAYRGLTKRTAVMFGPPGYTYVYLIYGMYHCLNIVTEKEGQASAVLIRSVKLPDFHLKGPGKVCQHLGITKHHNGIDLTRDHDMYVTQGIEINDIRVTQRIGIRQDTEKPWRFVADL